MMTSLFTLLMSSLPAQADASASVLDAVRAHVATVTGRSEADVEVTELRFEVPSDCGSSPTAEVESNPGERFRGQTSFRVRLTEGLRPCGRFSLSARVGIWEEVPVAAEAHTAGDAISSTVGRVKQSDLRSEPVDLTSGDWIASRALVRGQPITHRVARRKPAAATGDAVSIIAEFGALTVKAEGRMLAHAYIGDRVRVSNTATDTVVQGILVAPGVVRTGGRR